MAHRPGQIASAPLRAAGALARASVRALRAIGSGAVQSLSLVPSWLSGLLWLLSSSFESLANDGYAKNSVVYAALRVLSQSVPEPPLLAYTRDENGEPGERLPYHHPLCQLIRRPNELTTEYEFFELVTLHCAIAGRSHWWKERSARGDVLGLWPLRPDRVGPIYSDAMQAGQKVLSGWSYLIPGTTHYIPLPRQDVLTFHFPHPGGESGGLVEGLGPLQVLASEVGADNEATKFVGSMLANYGAPGVVLTVKTPLRSEDDAKLIKAAFVREFGGNRRGLPGVIDAETDIKPLGFDLSQLEFPNLRRISEARIAAAFGVPAIMVGLLVGLEAGIRATIAEQREYFAETTLANYWRRFSDQFTKDVASEFGADLICRFDLRQVKALTAQQKNEASMIERGFQMGTVEVDEYRERVLGLEPLPNGQGKVRILPRGCVEIDEEGNLAGVQPPPTVDTLQGAGAGGGETGQPPGQPAASGGQETAQGARRAPHVRQAGQHPDDKDGRVVVAAHPSHGARERVAAAYAAWAADHGVHSVSGHDQSNGH